MRPVLALLLGLLVLPALSAANPARAELQGGRRVALVIGNGAYRSVDRLANAANDARLMAGTLQKLGFILVGGGPNLDLDRAKLARAVQEFGVALQGAEVGLFYYSGHGLQVQGVNWLVPVDANPARPQDLDFQMVDADLVLRQMDGAGTKLNLVMLDACRNNPFASRGIRAVQSGLAEMRAPEGTLISYATQPGSVAADGAGSNSPYTTALAASMQQPGVDIFRMFNQVGLQVKRATGGSQQPWVSNSPIDGDFYFAGPPPAQPPPTQPPAGPQLAGVVQPPAPPLTPAAPQPAQAPEPTPQPAEPAARLLALTAGQRCAILDVKTTRTGLELTGLARAGPEWDSTMRQIAATRGLAPPRTQVEFVGDFACEPMEALAAPILATRQANPRRLLSLDVRELPAGGTLSLLLRGAEGKAVALDLYRPNGTVQHVVARATVTSAGSLRLRLPTASSSVPGPRLMVVVVSATPLELGERPHTEGAGLYLKALLDVLGRTPGAQVDLATYVLTSAATPASTLPRPPARPGRCAALLERAQLGETLPEADRNALRTECR